MCGHNAAKALRRAFLLQITKYNGDSEKVSLRWFVLLVYLTCVPALAEQSLLMPRASESLLLDAVTTGERVLVAGDYGHILYSDDDGDTWQQASVPTRRMLTAIFFSDTQRGWAVGHDGLILMTADGGEHWTLQRDGLADQKLINQRSLQSAQAALEQARQALLQVGDDGDLEAVQMELEDRELDLEDARAVLEEPLNAPPLLDVFFVDELRGVAVGAFNTFLRTTDGGVNWEDASDLLDNPDEFHLNAVTGGEDGRLWLAAEGGLLFRSDDAGASWQSLDSPYQGSWFGIIRAPGEEQLVVFGLRGNVFRSEDGGDSWSRVDAGTDRTLAGGAFVGGGYALLVGGVGTLLVSEDAGASFRSQTSGIRLNLSAVTSRAGAAIMVGQGGVHRAEPFGRSP